MVCEQLLPEVKLATLSRPQFHGNDQHSLEKSQATAGMVVALSPGNSSQTRNRTMMVPTKQMGCCFEGVVVFRVNEQAKPLLVHVS
jgi:hypothetical protein